MGSIYYLIGKSAAGKDKVYVSLLAREDLHLSDLVLTTTRPIRSGEIDGKQYHFVSEEEFSALRKAGKLIEERRYDTVAGPWYYGTSAEGIDLQAADYLAIGTVESFCRVRDYFGKEKVHGLYLDVSDQNLLLRSIYREAKQEKPNYKEVCRRFLADAEDMSDEKLAAAGICRRFLNNDRLSDCVGEIAAYIKEAQRVS